jgi:hypothetical protein
VRARCPCGLEALHGVVGDRGECLEPGGRALDSPDRRRVRDACAECRRDRDQRGMERPQRVPVGGARGRARAVDGLDRRLDLKAAHPSGCTRAMEESLALRDELRVPE